jgi:hypothetical protein
VQYQDDRADHDANDERPGDGKAQQPDIRISIRPKMAVPPTVLVTELDNGTLILQGRPDGPRVWLEPDDAAPLNSGRFGVRVPASALSSTYGAIC